MTGDYMPTSRYSMLGAEQKIAALEAERDTLAKRVEELRRASERLEAAIRGDQGEPRAILTTNVLRWPAEKRIAFARHLLGSEWKSPEHERLEGLLRACGTEPPDAETYHRREEAVYAEAERLARVQP